MIKIHKRKPKLPCWMQTVVEPNLGPTCLAHHFNHLQTDLSKGLPAVTSNEATQTVMQGRISPSMHTAEVTYTFSKTTCTLLHPAKPHPLGRKNTFLGSPELKQ